MGGCVKGFRVYKGFSCVKETIVLFYTFTNENVKSCASSDGPANPTSVVQAPEKTLSLTPTLNSPVDPLP